MKISELQALLSKASSLLGDAPIILKALEDEAETDVKGLVVTIVDAAAAEGGTVTVSHGAPTPVQVSPTPEEAQSPQGLN